MDKFYNSFALIEFLLQQKVHTVTSHNETRRLGYDNYKAQKTWWWGNKSRLESLCAVRTTTDTCLFGRPSSLF